MLLINLARIFELEADKQLPPPSSGYHQKDDINELKNSYCKNFCSEIKILKSTLKTVYL